jgi:hypothetical protein
MIPSLYLRDRRDFGERVQRAAMPGINLEALNTGDLHRLLKVAHARQDGPLADRLEWEIAARGTSAVHPASPFATLPDEEPEEPDEPGFRMNATDDAPIGPELRVAARRDPEIRTFEREAAEPRAVERFADALPPAARMAEAQPADRRQMLSIGLAALAGCLVTAALVWGVERMGERAALKRQLPAQVVTLAPVAPVVPLSGLSEPMPVEAAPAPGLATLQQAFSAPGAAARPAAVAHPKKWPRRPPARASAPQSETVEEATDATAQRAKRPATLGEWMKQEEPIY